MNQPKAPWYFLFLLILAGESIFILPFVLARVFRPTVLDVFELDNVQLGICFSVYGIVNDVICIISTNGMMNI